MTTLIKQQSDHDCALAAIAMATGASTWDEAWTAEDLARVIKENGVGDPDEWLARRGLVRLKDYRTVYIFTGAGEEVHKLLWKRRALLSVHSLNTPEGNHMIYWDGDTIFDPSPKRTYLHLRSCVIDRVVIFKD